MKWSTSHPPWMNEWIVFDDDDDVWLQSNEMKEKNKRNNMISFHSLLFLLFLMRKKNKKIDSHHADHNNNMKKKNTSDAMTSINQHQQEQEEEEIHTCFLHAIPMSPCVFFFAWFECFVVDVPTKKTQVIPNAGKSFFCFFVTGFRKRVFFGTRARAKRSLFRNWVTL